MEYSPIPKNLPKGYCPKHCISKLKHKRLMDELEVTIMRECMAMLRHQEKVFKESYVPDTPRRRRGSKRPRSSSPRGRVVPNTPVKRRG
jgi:hypothetical protein